MSSDHDDFAFEPVRGLPQLLPKGERMLWQGAPRWQDLAVHAFHARKVIWYFIGLSGLACAMRLAEGQTAVDATRPFLWLIPMGLIAAALLTLLAYGSARTTVYTVTSKRLVMRIGMALPVTINLPFSQIDGASLRLFSNGSGDIPLKVKASERVAFLMLWPHARPFHITHPQPCLRCIPNADDVASLVAAALTGTVPAVAARETRDAPSHAVAA
ncbi:photosynthetic complex putative assembly protein PuhB [Aestuariivirga sp.]|uniref:photosynthetic complex putative assembly protein PuhB n=1 Tax=Aestuariivirga sp. TaxID=2650926 RepID=UPI003BA8DFC9